MSKQLKYYGSTLSLDPVTIAWLAQLTTSFGSNPSSAYIADLDIMIRAWRANGTLTQLVRLWIFAQEVQGYARVSIVNPASTQITEVNTPTWTANQGYTGNSLNMYLNTNFNYSTDGGGILTRSSVFQAVYCRTNAATNTCEAGVLNAGNRLENHTRFGDGVTYIGANTNSVYAQAVVGNSLGLLAGVRSGSPAPTVGSRNATTFATSASQADNALPNRNDLVLCRNNSGVADQFTGKQIAMRVLGSGSVVVSDFYTPFQTFATSRGFNV